MGPAGPTQPPGGNQPPPGDPGAQPEDPSHFTQPQEAQPQQQSIGLPPSPMTAMDAISVAAQSLHTVIITYTDEKGAHTIRECEPYSLRPGKEGTTRFFAFDYLRGHIRGFRVDRIARAEVTEKPYVPKWVVEF